MKVTDAEELTAELVWLLGEVLQASLQHLRGSALDDDVDAVKRLIGWAAFSVMPEAGLDAALTSVREEYSYAQETLELPIPSTARRVIREGYVAEKEVRPALSIEE